MKKLIKEDYRSFRKKISQYIGLILFLTVSVFTFNGLFSAIFQVKNGIETLTQNSKEYDFQINVADLYPNDDEKIEDNLIDFNLTNYQALQTKILNLKFDKNKEIIWSSWNDIKLPNEKCKEKIATIVNNFDSNISAWLLSLAVKNKTYHDLEIDKKVVIDIAFVHFFRFETINAKNERQFFQAQLLTNDEKNCQDNKANSIYCRDITKVYSPTLGVNPKLNNGEVLISKQYAWKNGIKDNIFILSLLGDKSLSFSIKGYGASFETISPQLLPMETYVKNNSQRINLKNGAIIYTTKDDFAHLHSAFPNGSDSTFAYIKLNDGLSNAEKINYTDKLLSFYFVSPDDNIASFWKTLSGSIITTTNTSMLVIESITIVCSVIVAIILLFFIKKNVDSQKQQIGILKALGYKKVELVVVFMFTIVWTSILACVVGWGLSISLQMYFSNMNIFNISIVATPVYFNWKIITFVLLAIPLIIMVLAFIACYLNLNKDALSLIYNLERSKLNWFKFQYFLKPRKQFWLKISSAFALK